MLNKVEYQKWCDESGLPPATIELISTIRKSPPSRRVGGGASNVCGSYASRKMGRMIQFESHTVELPRVYFLEHDLNVLEYYCQPSPIDLHYLGPTGKKVVAHHTPDYFVIWKNGRAGWIEEKSADKLPLDAEKSPNRYQLVGNHWECPPGKAYAEPLGLCYVLHSSDEINGTFVRNAVFLDDHRRNNAPIPLSSLDVVQALMEKHPAITLQQLLEQTKDQVEEDCIFQMVATCAVWVDLSAAPLIEADRVHVFADRDTMTAFHASVDGDHIRSADVRIEPGALATWDAKSFQIANVGDHVVSLIAPNEAVIELEEMQFQSLLSEGRIQIENGGSPIIEHPEVSRCLATAHPDEMKIATIRATQIQEYLRGEIERPHDIPLRTWQKRIADYRSAQDLYGSGMVGIMPKTKRRGNRSPKLRSKVQELMIEHIKKDYETMDQPRRFESHAKRAEILKKRHLPVPSYKTFCKFVSLRPRGAQTLKRQGQRAAYKDEEFHFYLRDDTPRHGERPFEVVHIDHTELDVELIDVDDGKNLGRPWLTIMTDAFSRRFLAHYLSFDPPSYRSCMMVFRECVRRHGRPPQMLVMDNGKEFHGNYFAGVLAFHEITPKWRPPAESRFGSVCERLFGVTNTQFIHLLRGNTQITKQVRQVTKSNNPKGRAIWDILSLENRLKDFLYEVRDNQFHGELGQTPHEAFVARQHLGGKRKNRTIVYNTTFLVETAPTTAKGTAKVISARGVTINYFDYWSEAFRDPTLQGKQVHVRYDPFNLGIAWAFVSGRWVECTSRFYNILYGRSERELMIVSRKLRQQHRLAGRYRFTITAKQLADFMSRIDKDQELMMQHQRDRACRELRGSMGKNPPAVGTAESPSTKIADRSAEAKTNRRELVLCKDL